ncbi:MAG: type II toxin-antitoxin system VapC family toxin [Desulfobacterales bacterium]|nr:type II toxin-antitoxin system VapC family toxin [Desulfobacterales bacterium]
MKLLDTNIVSYWMRGDKRIIETLREMKPCDLSISTITLAEILYGIEKSKVRKKERRDKIERICSQIDIFPFDEDAALEYGIIRAYLEKKGEPISERDLQIASIAKANDFVIVTHNVKEFKRVVGLTVEDWVE